MNPIRKLLRKIQAHPIRHYEKIDGWLTVNEALGLYHIAKSLPQSARITEIGSWKGKSTYCLASGLAQGTIFAIDPFDASGEAGSKELYDKTKGSLPLVEQFKQNLDVHGLLHKIKVLQGYSNQFAGTIKDIDFLFIDGDHSKEGCEYDFKTFSPEVKRNGWLAFHDYAPNRPELGPTWVVENLVRKSTQWRAAGRWDSLIAFRRNP